MCDVLAHAPGHEVASLAKLQPLLLREPQHEESIAEADAATCSDAAAEKGCATSQCQVCFDDILQSELVSTLCGPECPALLCKACLNRHLEVSLGDCFKGMLPALKCPICLIPIRKSGWDSYVETNDPHQILEQYRRLCEIACSFLPPCCHSPFYTHLPLSRGEFPTDEQDSRSHAPSISSDVLTALPHLDRLTDQFCSGVGVTARDFVAYVIDTIEAHHSANPSAFGGGDDTESVVDDVMYGTMASIDDHERRATLLLTFLYLKPNVRTHCCAEPICFNCKRMDHHDGMCADFDEVFDEDDCLVQCRSCRAMLLKVEGCEQVSCPCGFNMVWWDELSYRGLYLRGLLPVDMFDRSLFAHWNVWKSKLGSIAREIPARYTQVVVGGKVKKWLKMGGHKALIRSVFARFVWRRRFQRNVQEDLLSQVWRMRYKRIVCGGI